MFVSTAACFNTHRLYLLTSCFAERENSNNDSVATMFFLRNFMSPKESLWVKYVGFLLHALHHSLRCSDEMWVGNKTPT